METIARPEKGPSLKTHVFTVKELTYVIKDLLEGAFPFVWVEGEIANLRSPNSGHLYFTLRDEEVSLRAVLFRGQRAYLKFRLEDGLHVLCFGRLSVYEPRGEYQLIVQLIEPRGLGALQLAFEQLKEKLAQKGFFDPSRKRPLPLLPKTVGLVTSLTGAALRDFLKVALSRYPKARIIIFPVRVQGEGAAQEIAEGIRVLGSYQGIELIVVTRGGGSLEDLWAFNEEIVAKAIYHSPVPVVSAVGHEIDYTICDFVADVRAPTPTAAAQIIFPSLLELHQGVEGLKRRLFEAAKNLIAARRQQVIEVSNRLRDPRDELRQGKARLRHLQERIIKALSYQMHYKREKLAAIAKHLEAVSPLSVLSRGYSLVRRLPDQRLITEAGELKIGDRVEILFRRGKARAKIEEIL